MSHAHWMFASLWRAATSPCFLSAGLHAPRLLDRQCHAACMTCSPVRAQVSTALRVGRVVDLGSLAIARGRAAWVAYLDLYVLDADGGLFDAALLAALAALGALRLPHVDVDEDGKVGPWSTLEKQTLHNRCLDSCCLLDPLVRDPVQVPWREQGLLMQQGLLVESPDVTLQGSFYSKDCRAGVLARPCAACRPGGRGRRRGGCGHGGRGRRGDAGCSRPVGGPAGGALTHGLAARRADLRAVQRVPGTPRPLLALCPGQPCG